MTLLIDNYDSFAYNLYQFVGSIDENVKVIRNDEMTVPEIEALAPTAVILSPGPGRPSSAGVCEALIQKLGGKTKILGVCLGHQAICEAFGGKITYAKELMHGRECVIHIEKPNRLFHGIGSSVTVARYHSLAADASTLPACLEITALSPDGEIMAVKHRTQETYGLQFHPESVMTPQGMQMIQNFLEDKHYD